MIQRNKPFIWASVSIFMGALVVLGLSQCQTIKNMWLIGTGGTEQSEFGTTLDYEYRFGVMVVKPTIEGKTYRFILDSGSPSVALSDSLAEALGLEQKSTVNAGDTHGKEQSLPLGELDQIVLGGVQFNDMAAFVSKDLRASFPFKCFDNDGLIGTNLMRHAVWQFDFRDTQIHIADRQSKLPHPEPAYTFPMDNDFLEKPHLTTQALGDQKILLDLGSNGGLQANKKQLPVLKDSLGLRYMDSAQRIGVSSFGLYGSTIDTVRHLLVDTFSFNGMPIMPLSIRPQDDGHILGLDFLRDYRLTLNWETETIGLTPYPDAQPDTNLVGVGFNPMYDGESLVVKTIYKPSPAWDAGLRYKDTIVGIKTSSTRKNLMLEDNCSLAQSDKFQEVIAADKEQDQKSKMIIQRNGIMDTFNLYSIVNK